MFVAGRTNNREERILHGQSSAAFLGPFVEKDIKKSALISTVCFVCGFAGTRVSIAAGWLPGVFISYGVIMGIGLGVGYLTPVKNLMLWFADNKGLATGIAVAGFGLAKAIAGSISVVLAVDAVFNAAGRIGFSTLSDHCKRRETAYLVIFIMSIAVCALQIFTHSIDNGILWLIVTMLFLVNAGYGGGFSTLPVLLEQHFGMKSVSTVHGLALSAWAFAGLSGNQLASFVVSHTTDAAHRYSALIPIITILYAVALASIIAVTLATKGKSANALSSR